MKRFYLVLLTLISFSIGFPSLGDPDQTSDYFMNEPASIMDIGILRLQILLNNRGIKAEVYYDFSDDQIVIEHEAFFDNTSNNEAHEKVADGHCRGVIAQIRGLAGYLPAGQLSKHFPNNRFSDFFAHSGYTTIHLEELDEHLQNLSAKFVVHLQN